MKEREYLLALNMIDGFGPLRIGKLLGHFKSAEGVFSASGVRLKSVLGIGNELIRRIKEFSWDDLKIEISLCEKEKIRFLIQDDPEYPQLLKHIPDPPIVLYYRGDIKAFDFNFAIVGSRRASFYGLTVAQKFGYQLAARGITVVSGLARGIDSAAHQGALNADGRTIAVLGSGLLVMYPPENKKLAENIVKKGLLISEYPLHMSPRRENFPRRNRVVSGLSYGVLVVEAARRSGALITADSALEQNRDVYAIPGGVNSPTSSGTNYLIKQGAKLVESVADILEEYDIKVDKLPLKADNVGINEKKVLESIKEGIWNIDQLVVKTKLGLGELNEILLTLQVKGMIKSTPGGNYSII